MKQADRIKSPLGRVLGLGSAGSGTEHWWGQRLSAAALVPLALWFAGSLALLPSADFATVRLWLDTPVHSLLVVFLVLAATFHSGLGLQVVAEDYVHAPALRVAVLGLLRLLHVALAVAGVFAVLSVTTGVPL